MQLRSYRDIDRDLIIGIFGRGIVFTRKPSHILDKEVYPAYARHLFQQGMEKGNLCSEGIFVGERVGRVVGAVSAAKSETPAEGEIRWLAAETSQSLAADIASLLNGAANFLKRSGCDAAVLRAWMDKEQQAAAAAIENAGYEPVPSDQYSILMGAPLSDLPPVPELPPGYWAHRYRPGDEGPWAALKSLIFESQDGPETFERLYSGRSSFDPDEVVFVEHGDELVGICAGVKHEQEIGDVKFPTAYLDWVGVKEGHRGKRLGAFVCLTCMHFLKERGVTYCTLVTQPFRKAAVKLYTQLGFVTLAEERVYRKALRD